MAANQAVTEAAPAAEAPKTKKKRAAFTRTPKPVFALVSYKDEDGNPIRLIKSNLSIVLENDAAKVMDILESGEGTATMVRVALPSAPKRVPATPAA
jgi:hypothetical protein